MSFNSAPAPPGYAQLTIGVIVVCTIFPILSAVSVVARFWIRHTYKIAIQADDWIIIPALLLTITTCSCGIWGAVSGHAVYFLQVFYICALPLIKCSILLFYNRIFPTKRFRLLSYGVAVFLVCWWIAFELSTIFQCLPINANWLIGTESIPLCINEYVMYDTYSAMNLLTDIFILAMPWPMILKLQMGRKKKIQLLGIFLLGSFICIAGIAHLVYVILLEEPWTEADSTHYQGYIFIWFCIEPCTGIICACLPTYSPLIVRSSLFSRFISTIRSYLLSSSSRGRNGNLTTKPSDDIITPYKDAKIGGQSFKRGEGFARIPDALRTETTVEHIPLQDFERRIHSTVTNIMVDTDISTKRSLVNFNMK